MEMWVSFYYVMILILIKYVFVVCKINLNIYDGLLFYIKDIYVIFGGLRVFGLDGEIG